MAGIVRYEIFLNGSQFNVFAPTFDRSCSFLGCSTSLGFVTPTEALVRRGLSFVLPYQLEKRTYKFGEEDVGASYGVVRAASFGGEYLEVTYLESGSLTVESFSEQEGAESLKGYFSTEFTYEGGLMKFEGSFDFSGGLSFPDYGEAEGRRRKNAMSWMHFG